MKCDELKPINITDECGSYRVYNKSDVDAAIDELKAEHHKERHEYIKMIAELKQKLQDQCISCPVKMQEDDVVAELKQKLEDAKASAYAESVDAGMENRRLKRALWIARAERASDKARIFYFAETCGVTLNIDGFSNKEKGHSRMCTASWWKITWLKVERKCRAKAKEYDNGLR